MANGNNDRHYFLGLQNHCRWWLVQSLSCVRVSDAPWTAALQASLSITNSRSPSKPMSIELVMPSKHLILCWTLLLLPSIFPSIRVFSNESVLRIRWPRYWSFSFNISLSNSNSGLPIQNWSPLGWTGWTSLLIRVRVNKHMVHSLILIWLLGKMRL